MQYVFCLNCMAANQFGRESCVSCGMPLPRSSAGEAVTPSAAEEEMAERFNMMEDRINHLSSTVEELLKYIHAVTDEYDTDLVDIDDLHQFIKESNAEREAVEEFWQNSIAGYLRFVENRYHFDQRVEAIIKNYDGDRGHLIRKLIERAQIHFFAHQHSRCLKFIERALRMSPENHELLFFLGEKLYLMNQPDKAIATWTQVLNINPRHYRASLMVGILKLMRGDTLNARHLLKDATRRCNDGIVPLLALATLEYQEGCFTESERYIKLANRIYETAFGHVLLAENFNKREHPRKAVAELENAVKLKPNDKRLLVRLATQYLQVGFLKRAQKTFSRISMISPQEPLFQDLAKKKTTPEMLDAFKNSNEYSTSGFLMHSVSELLINELA